MEIPNRKERTQSSPRRIKKGVQSCTSRAGDVRTRKRGRVGRCKGVVKNPIGPLCVGVPGPREPKRLRVSRGMAALDTGFSARFSCSDGFCSFKEVPPPPFPSLPSRLFPSPCEEAGENTNVVPSSYYRDAPNALCSKSVVPSCLFCFLVQGRRRRRRRRFRRCVRCCGLGRDRVE